MRKKQALYFTDRLAMTENTFWNCIAKARQEASSDEMIPEILTTLLRKRSTQEVLTFYLWVHKFVTDAFSSDMWCAADCITGYATDDGFVYFLGWLVAQGKETYYAALKNPDSLATTIDFKDNAKYYDLEGLAYGAIEIFEENFDLNFNDAIGLVYFPFECVFKPITLNWRSDNPESMMKICPVLYENRRDWFEVMKKNPQYTELLDELKRST